MKTTLLGLALLAGRVGGAGTSAPAHAQAADTARLRQHLRRFTTTP